MDNVFFFLITCSVAAIFASIARHYKIAAGAFMGALFGAAAFNILFGRGFFPSDVRKVVQVFSGALIGSRVLRSNILALKKIIAPTIMLIVGLMLMNFCTGLFLTRFGGLDVPTALFASAPGGLSDMAIIAEDMGADTIIVALMQMLRVLAVYLIFPQVIGWMLKKRGLKLPAHETLQEQVEHMEEGLDEPEQDASFLAPQKRFADFAITMTSATLGGVLATLAGVPAGPMVGALFFTAISNMVFNRGFFPNKIRPVIQILAGAYIGSQMNGDTLQALGTLFVPAIILVICLVGFSVALAFLVHKVTKLDFGVCLLGCAPAGVQEMSLLADDLGVDSTKVAIMHTFRLSSVIAFFPILLRALCFIL